MSFFSSDINIYLITKKVYFDISRGPIKEFKPNYLVIPQLLWMELNEGDLLWVSRGGLLQIQYHMNNYSNIIGIKVYNSVPKFYCHQTVRNLLISELVEESYIENITNSYQRNKKIEQCLQ